MPRQFFQVPFVLAPEEAAVQQVLTRLTELAQAAVAEKDSASQKNSALETFSWVLHQAMAIIDDSANPKQSVGIRWLTDAKNRTLFRQIVSGAQSAALFKVHLKNRYIVAMLEDRNLLSLIPEEERVSFTCAVLNYWIPETDDWISVVLSSLIGDTEIRVQTLMKAVLRWLRNPEDFEGGDAFAARFLRTGPGPSLKTYEGHWTLRSGCSRLWHLFKTEQSLTDALRICAISEPNVFFEVPATNDIPVSHKVKLRLGSGMAAEILELALSNVETRDGLSAAGLDCLTKRLMLRVIRQPEICPLPFLVKFALDYIDLDGYPKFDEYVDQITPHCTDYAADLVESFAYTRDATITWAPAPCIPGRIALIEQKLRENAAAHDVDLSTLEL